MHHTAIQELISCKNWSNEITSKTILYAVDRQQHFAQIMITRPEKRNALTWSTMIELADAFRQADQDEAVQVIILTGVGKQAFCAGVDLETLGAANAYEVYRVISAYRELIETIQAVGKLVIARIQGYALGGGLGLAMASDIAICTTSSILGAPEVNVGIFPMLISPAILRNVPHKHAIELLFTGKHYSGREAAEIGLVTRAIADDQLDAEVERISKALVAKSPVITRIGKEAIALVQDMSLHQALRALQAQLVLVLSTEDAREGLTAFTEKRQPKWRGR